MAAGLGLLRLAPRDFWAMTPRELEGALAPLTPAAAAVPGRAELARLMRAYPDQPKEEPHG